MSKQQVISVAQDSHNLNVGIDIVCVSPFKRFSVILHTVWSLSIHLLDLHIVCYINSLWKQLEDYWAMKDFFSSNIGIQGLYAIMYDSNWKRTASDLLQK